MFDLFYSCGSSLNWDGYCNPEVDRIYASSASCWQPAVKGLTLMVNTVFSSCRFEDIWLDR